MVSWFFLLASAAALAGCAIPETTRFLNPPATAVAVVPRCIPPPKGGTTLFLRGTMNSWAPLESFAFQFSCDAYYLNANLIGKQRFKIADVSWSDALSYGGAAGGVTQVDAMPVNLTSASSPGGAGDLESTFTGEHSLSLSFENGLSKLTIGPKTFRDPREVTVTDKVALSVSHDSRDLLDKTPFGAISAGTQVQFGFRADKGITSATLIIQKQVIDGNQERILYEEVTRLPLARLSEKAGDRWTVSHTFPNAGIYSYFFEVGTAEGSYVYHNNNEMIFWTREQGSNGKGKVASKAFNLGVRGFRQTVHAPDFKVPEWAQDAVYYYIFPERFRNGDRSNDPKPVPSRDPSKAIEFHENWLDQPWQPGDGSDLFGTNDFFGGDLAGIIEKLDYIASLGANTLYLTPIFRAASNHKYDTADYRTIDPAFGKNADFSLLSREAAKRGIRVIADTSLNHTGRDSLYFDYFSKYPRVGAFEAGKIRPHSPYASWYHFDPSQAEPDRQYRSWTGARDLPELNESSASFRDYAYRDANSVMKQWLDLGAAGWRMDVAPWVPDDFWREWRDALKSHRSSGLLIAETWFDASKFFLGDSFDATMNYIFRDTALNYAAGTKASSIYHNIEFMREMYPQQALLASMNLLSTHDTARSLHFLGGDEIEADANAMARAKRRLLLAAFFQMTSPGSPAIFYGDEVGVTGGDDPDNRRTYPWQDLGGQPDLELLAQFRRLIKLRNDYSVLRRGTMEAPLHLDDHLIVLVRREGAKTALTATNNSEEEREIQLKLPAGLAGQELLDAFTGMNIEQTQDIIRLRVPPLYGLVLTNAAARPAASAIAQ